MTGPDFAADMDDDARRLCAFVAGGQDKAGVGAIYVALEAELQPTSLIERMWLRDIARLMVRSEELRLVQIAVHKHLLACGVEADAEQGGTAGRALPSESPTPRAGCDLVTASAASVPAAGEPGPERLLARTYAEHLALFDQLARMEQAVRADRDRVISQLDRRRSQALMDTLEALVA